jgi:hypothetical protein
MQSFFTASTTFSEYAFAQKHLLLDVKIWAGSFTIQMNLMAVGCVTTCELSWEMFGPKVLLLRATIQMPAGAGWWHWVAQHSIK